MGGKMVIKADSLAHELDCLAEKYQGNHDALLLVDALRCWLAEETVFDADEGV